MALVALLAFNRSVDVIEEYPALVGAMGVMTGGAARFRDRVIHVLTFEGGLVRAVALEAEGGHRLFQ